MSLPIPTDAGDLVASLTGQPALFSDLDVSVEVVRAGRDYLHTGTTTSAHHDSAAKIIAGAVMGWSERKIARDLGHSRNTVAAVLRDAVRSGKVEPVKERVIAAAAAAIHSDIERGNDLMEEAETPQDIAAVAGLRRSTWVGAGILADKGGAAGPASVVVNVGAGSVVQVVEGYAARLKALAVDYESKANTTKPEGIEVNAEVRHYGDTKTSRGSDELAGPGAGGDRGEEGGGGGGISMGGTE
jgi:hypothetical protein